MLYLLKFDIDDIAQYVVHDLIEFFCLVLLGQWRKYLIMPKAIKRIALAQSLEASVEQSST